MKDEYDVLIIGTGLSGLSCALNLNPNLKIGIISKTTKFNCDSYLAQGGIACLKDEYDENDYIEDTLKAGHFENNIDIVKDIINKSPNLIEFLVYNGVIFDKNDDGSYNRHLEGGHSKPRILHVKDYTGKAIIESLMKSIESKSNIDVIENTMLIDILTKDNKCIGAIINKENDFKKIIAKKIVLATGGIGGIFPASTNFPEITGDAIAIALKNNVELSNIDYIQIHPTLLYSNEKDRKFLISEAVRGAGGILLNKYHKRFINELLPRDIVSNSILNEMKKTNENFVFLSLEKIKMHKFELDFPTILKKLNETKINFKKELIKVRPGQHYHMGGIKADKFGKTSLKNLYAIGECACTGFHGRNRLASNSLLESTYLGITSSQNINETIEYDEFINLNINFKNLNLNDIQDNYKKILKTKIKEKDPDFYELWFNV